jgi:soluble lytic murein transglycosylase-like protein/TolA-binding protein
LMLLSLTCTALAMALPGQDHYLEGRQAEQAGQYQRAIDHYLKCVEEDEYLKPYAGLRIGACQAKAGRSDVALETYHSVLRDFPEGPWVRMAQAESARLLSQAGNHELAIPFYAQALDGAPDIWFLYSLRWSSAESSLKTANPLARAQAFAYLRGVAEVTVLRQRRDDATALLKLSDDPRDLIAAGFAHVKSREFDHAAKLIPTIEARVANYIELRTRLDELRAKVLLGQKKPLEAYLLLQRLASATPPDPRVLLAYAETTRGLLAAKYQAQADGVIALLAASAPASEAHAEALWGRAEHLAQQGDSAAAKAYFEVHALCPTTPRAGRALFAAAELYRARGQWQASAEAYLTLAKEHPKSPSYGEAVYWGGLMLERLGQIEAAKQVYGLADERHLANYYAHRACERRHELLESGEPAFADLRAGGATSFVRPIVHPCDRIDDVDEAFANLPAIRRLQLFGHHGFEEAEWEAIHLAQNIDRNPQAALIFQTMSEAGVAYSAIQIARAVHWGENADGSFTRERLRLMHPRAYWPEVVAISRETGVDPYLILAVAYHESTFRPALTSRAGARGLMQVMPGTAEYLRKIEPSITEHTIANLDSPINSLRLGAHYLMRMIERTDANYAFALASYNAGPGNLNKWRKARPNMPLHDFIEAIPFGETNNYVKKVLGTYAAYHSLYPPAMP